MSDSLRQSVSQVNQQLGLVDKKTLATAAKFAALASGAAAAAGAMAVGFIKSGNDYIRTMNGISAQTGVTGEELQQFGAIARSVYTSGKGENFQEVADALVNIQQASGLAGAELEAATNLAMLLKDTFAMETNETTRAATALMKNFGITAEEAYGIIAVGAQNGANKNGDLLDTLNEYSVHYKALGLDADQFIQSLIAGADAGSFSIDKIGDAVKEFTIRSKDGSKTSAEAFAAIGLSAETMTAAFAAGGDAAEAAFFQTVRALNSMEDPVAKNAAGVALFGTMFEDLEAGMLNTMASMGDASIDAAAALRQMEAVKYNDIGYAITQISRSFSDALIPSAEAAGQTVFNQMPAIRASIEKVVPSVTALATSFAAALPGIIEFIAAAASEAAWLASVIGDNWEFIVPVITGVAGAFAAFKIIGVINTLTVTWTAISTGAAAATTALGATMAFLTSPIFLLSAAIGAAIAAGVLLYRNWDTVMAYAGRLGAYLGGVWTSIKDGCAAMTSSITGLFSAAFAAIPGILKAPINAAISLINGAINAINGIGFTIPDWVPGIGGQAFSVNIPNIPMLARGGFTTGPSIAGEAGQEAVISFDPAYRAQNIGYLQEAAARLGVDDDMTVNYYADQLASLGVDNLTPSSTAITYNLGGLVFSPTVTVAGGDISKDSIIEQLRNYHGELLELIEELLQEKEAGSYGTSGVF
nr:MAG TPA: minor tail protein [Caudoviricetes sp.]